MSTNLIEKDGIVLSSIAAGRSVGFVPTVRAYCVATRERLKALDSVVVTRAEAVEIALAILRKELHDKGHPTTLADMVADVLNKP